MISSLKSTKAQLIQDIIRLQQDFQVLTDRSNGLQHQNQFLQNQLADLQSQLQLKRKQSNTNENYENQQLQWPLYLDIQGNQLPQQPGEYIKFLGTDGHQYVQYLQLIQYLQTNPDGKTQHVVGEQYKVVQMPLQMFEKHHGPFSQFGLVQEVNQNKQQEKIIEKQQKEQKQIQQKDDGKFKEQVSEKLEN